MINDIAAPPTAVPFTLTVEQENAIDFTMRKILSHQEITTAISGPAGSGKTTLLRALAERLSKKMNVTVSAMTNKATVVLRKKGIEACTLHQACMRPIFRPPLDKLANVLQSAESAESWDKVKFPQELIDQYGISVLESAVLTVQGSGICAALRQLGIKDVFRYIESWFAAPRQPGVLIIDEASMLGKTEFDIASETYAKIILVGDEYQLGPVRGFEVFWAVPDTVRLTEIHRQAADSQPLRLATTIRTGGDVDMRPVTSVDPKMSASGIPTIVWRNATREKLTEIIRDSLGYDKRGPQVGEILICRNGSDRAAKSRGFINNSMWKVVESKGFVCSLENEDGEILHNEDVHIEEWEQGDGLPFRFAYVLTCHNSQGSEWPQVMIHQPDASAFSRFKPKEYRRWIYTAMTRAKDEVLWINRVK